MPTPEVAATPRPAARQELPDPPTPPPAEPRIVPHPKVAHTLRHRKAVTAVAFSPHGCRLATASADKTARIWVLSDDE
ncbi:MAG: WD40 repeat domain-containing protein [Pseudonocardiaceae bacterium]